MQQRPLSGKILIIDDEKDICSTLSGILQDEGHQVMVAQLGEVGLKLAKRELPDICLVDVWLPDADGVELIPKIQQISQDIYLIMISGHANIETAVRCTHLGAMDFLEKPLSLEKVLLTVQNLLKIKSLKFENQNLRTRINQKYELIGKSKYMKDIFSTIAIIAPKNSTVLVTGENGTGKENISRLIHEKSLRANKPFVAINCAAIPEDLIESELFGHEKGAFTGAVGVKRGKFELANGGTLFLDEIGDMSLKTQSKLLRVIQEKRFERVGSDESISIDVRIVAATNKNLEESIKKGLFREDLFYRINVIPIFIQPLRSRKEDIFPIANYYLQYYSSENKVKPKTLSSKAIQILQTYHWPGNVRELKNIMERVSIMVSSDVIDESHFQFLISESFSQGYCLEFHSLFESDNFREARSLFEKRFIEIKLQQNGGNISKTAEKIGLERSHLYRKMKQNEVHSEMDEEIEGSLAANATTDSLVE